MEKQATSAVIKYSRILSLLYNDYIEDLAKSIKATSVKLEANKVGD